MECAYSPWRMGDRKFCIFGELFRKNFGTMARFKDRRSIRKYSRRGIPEGLIEALAGEASRAATMGNMQLYSLVVTEDGPEREALAAAHHHQPMVQEAPAVLTFCADFHRFSRWCEERDAAPGYGNFVSFINAATDTLLFAQAFITLARSAVWVPAFSVLRFTIPIRSSRPCICRPSWCPC